MRTGHGNARSTWLPWFWVILSSALVEGRVGGNVAAIDLTDRGSLSLSSRDLQVRASVAPRSGGNEEFCPDNTVLYHVNIDLQLEYHGAETVQCPPGDNTKVNNAIMTSMNDNFVSAVPDWVGNVGFGPVTFDDSQDVETRRLTGGSEEEEVDTTSNAEQQHHRSLQSVCRSRNVACEADYCRWGCLLAPSTNCGVSTVTNWVNLEDHIKSALQDLKLDCLGDTDALQVNLEVVDPGTGAATVTRQKSATDSDTFEEYMKTVLHQEESGGDDVATDAPSKTLQVNCMMKFIFFAGKARDPSMDEVATLKSQTMAFFELLLTSHPDFRPVYHSLTFSTLRPIYNQGTKEFSLLFRTLIEVDEDSSVTSRMASQIIADADYKVYINDFVRADDRVADIFHETFKVIWHGTTGRNN